MNIDYIAIGARIRQLRTEKGLTQAKLAELSEQEPSNVSHIERGATKLSLGTLVSIANVLGCSVDDLLCDSILCEREAFENEWIKILKDCSPKELRMITDLAQAMKESMRKRNYND